MKRRREQKADKIEPQMAPMIDVVFQLLIFFMLTLKIVKEEGDFNINMPVSGAASETAEIPLDIKVYMAANPDGTLASVNLGERQFPASPQVFDRLNSAIIGLVGRPGSSYNDDVEVTIEFDYDLHYNNVVQAVAAATGKVVGGVPQVYVKNIKFAPPRNAPGAG